MGQIPGCQWPWSNFLTVDHGSNSRLSWSWSVPYPPLSSTGNLALRPGGCVWILAGLSECCVIKPRSCNTCGYVLLQQSCWWLRTTKKLGNKIDFRLRKDTGWIVHTAAPQEYLRVYHLKKRAVILESHVALSEGRFSLQLLTSFYCNLTDQTFRETLGPPLELTPIVVG